MPNGAGYADALQPFVTGRSDVQDTPRPYVGAIQPFIGYSDGITTLGNVQGNINEQLGSIWGGIKNIGRNLGQGLADTGQALTSPPIRPPAGSITNDAGFISQGGARPEEWQAFVRDQKLRNDLGPSIALGMIGSGSPFSARGSLGVAGGKLTRSEMDTIRDARFENKIKEEPTQIFKDFMTGDTPVRSIEESGASAERLAATHRQLNAETAGRIDEIKMDNIAKSDQIGGIVGRHLKNLYEAGVNREKFENVLQGIREDKSISAADLRTISQTYGNHVYKGSKEAMLDQIEKSFIRDARFMNKIGQ